MAGTVHINNLHANFSSETHITASTRVWYSPIKNNVYISPIHRDAKQGKSNNDTRNREITLKTNYHSGEVKNACPISNVHWSNETAMKWVSSAGRGQTHKCDDIVNFRFLWKDEHGLTRGLSWTTLKKKNIATFQTLDDDVSASILQTTRCNIPEDTAVFKNFSHSRHTA